MDDNKVELKRLDEPFVMVPNRLWMSTPDAAYVQVWCSIFFRANGNAEGCWATLINIAKAARIGQHKTRDAIKWLVENGWLHETKRPGYTTIYTTDLRGEGPLRGVVRAKSPVRGKPYKGPKDPPLQGLLDKQDPLKQDQNSLSSSGISDEIPTDEAANAVCSGFFDPFDLASPSIQEPPKRKPRAKGPEDFEQFWKLYLSAPRRAASQSKPKALAQWRKTICHDTVDSLVEALETEIAHQQAAAGTFVSPLPDCFRWLRDERYATVNDKPIGQQPINHATYVF